MNTTQAGVGWADLNEKIKSTAFSYQWNPDQLHISEAGLQLIAVELMLQSMGQ